MKSSLKLDVPLTQTTTTRTFLDVRLVVLLLVAAPLSSSTFSANTRTTEQTGLHKPTTHSFQEESPPHKR